MEALLSMSFDNLSSRDTNKVRKGVRQIEGLLAQICLSQSAHVTPSKRPASVMLFSEHASSKSLDDLDDDPAFLEFLRLQESFEWNVATQLVDCLGRLLGMGSGNVVDQLIASTLDVLLGMLLLHPPSKSLFNREIYMNLLLDLLDPRNRAPILSSALLVLTGALLSCPRNIRSFESTDGLHTVTSLFKSPNTPTQVKNGVADFLQLYLMDEASGEDEGGGVTLAAGKHECSPSRSSLASSSSRWSGSSGPHSLTRTTLEKRRLLEQYLRNVGDFVMETRDANPFGLAHA